LNERLRALPPVQKFLMLPLPRRLFLVRVGAAVFAGLIALLFLLLLLPPRHATIIVRSDPDQAAISSEGQSLGETPITVELKRNAVLKIALHKDGYEDADEEISADGEHVVLIKLNKKAAEPSGSAGKPSAKNPDGKTPGKPDGKKDPNRGGKKNDASDPVKPDPIKPDPVKPDPVKPDPVKPDPVKPDPVKPNPIKPDPVKPDPVKPDPVKPDPAKGKKPSKPVKGGKKPKKKIVVF
jgi:hypothetical protein